MSADSLEDGWINYAPGVRGRMYPSDMGFRIEPEDPAEMLARLELERMLDLPDEDWAREALMSQGGRGLQRAEMLATARRRVREGMASTEDSWPLLDAVLYLDDPDMLQAIFANSTTTEMRQQQPLPNPNIFDSGQTLLFTAVSRGKLQHARVLLENGASPEIYSLYENFNDNDVWQLPLHRAAHDWRPDMVQLLVDHGARVDALSLMKGQAPLVHALHRCGHTIVERDWADLIRVVRILVDAGADVGIRDDYTANAMDLAVLIAEKHSDEDLRPLIQMLMDAGADINGPGHFGDTPFIVSAAVESRFSPFWMLLQDGAPEINRQNDSGETALHFLAERGALPEIIAIVKRGADPKIQAKNGETPLHRAAAVPGLYAIVERLLMSGDATIARQDGRTAVDLALEAGGIKTTVQVFLSHDATRDWILANFEAIKRTALCTGTTENRFAELFPLSSGPSPPLVIKPVSIRPQPNADTAAFITASQRFDAIKYAAQSSLGRIVPKRLIDINTGQLVSGDRCMKYVIGSYLWSPENIAGIATHPHAYRTGAEYFACIAEACGKFPDLISTDPGAMPGTLRVPLRRAWPAKHLYPADPPAEYLGAVYGYLASEAELRNLHYVWIDSLCIDQGDDEDKREQIPLMADYYRNAECCVAISESLRRRLKPEYDPSRLFFDTGDSIVDRILGWTVGFHHTRVWCLQETRLAKEVVSRGGPVRIRTSAALSAVFESEDPAANKLWRLADGPLDTQEKTAIAICRAAHKLPLADSRLQGGQPISMDFIQVLLRDRLCKFGHDKIYGMLGLFPAEVRKSLPVDYNLSLSTIATIFNYLRICFGELAPLLSLRAPDHPLHLIDGAPSWLPTGYGSNYHDVLDIVPDAGLNVRVEPTSNGGWHADEPTTAGIKTGLGCAAVLRMHMPFVRIADCLPIDNQRSQDPVGKPADDSSSALRTEHGNITLLFQSTTGELLHHTERGAVEPVDPDLNLTSDSTFGAVGGYIQRPPFPRTALSSENQRKITLEREERRLRIQIAAREGRAVAARFGVERRGQGTWEDALFSVWMLLIARQETASPPMTSEGGLMSDPPRNDTEQAWTREGLMVVRLLDESKLLCPNTPTQCEHSDSLSTPSEHQLAWERRHFKIV